jgi:hypothetical protein
MTAVAVKDPEWHAKSHSEPMARVEAATEVGKVSFVVSLPPTPSDLERWRLTAQMPGLADAEWTAQEEL